MNGGGVSVSGVLWMGVAVSYHKIIIIARGFISQNTIFMIKRTIAILFVIFMVMISPLQASKPDTLAQLKPLNYDTTYIKSYRDLFHLTLVGVNKQTGVTLANVNSVNDLEFATNNPFGFGLAFDYKWATFEYTHTFSGLELRTDKKGESDAFAFRFGLTGRKLRMNFFIRSTVGFYLKNIQDYDPDWFQSNRSYPHFDDLANITLALSVYYTFNHRKYSNTAALWQIDQQKKSAGSPVIGFLTNLESIATGSPLSLNDTLLAGQIYPDFKEGASLKVGLSGGYMHTFVLWHRFYLHGALIQGFLYSRGVTEFYNNQESRTYNTLGLSLYSRITAGYNGNRIYGGVFFVSDGFIDDALNDTYSVTAYNYFRIYVGYRFPIKTPEWMRKFGL